MTTLITLVCIAGLLAAAAPHLAEQISQAVRRSLAHRNLLRAQIKVQAAAAAAIDRRTQRAEKLLETAVALLRNAAEDSDELDSANEVDRALRISGEVTNSLRTQAEVTIRSLNQIAQETEALAAQFESPSDHRTSDSNRYQKTQGEAA